MSSTAIAIIAGAMLLPVLLTGLPIAFSILLVCLAYVLTSGSDGTVPVTTMFWFLNSSSLVAIPFFILAAEILARSGATDALVKASNAVFGGARNGLALVTVVAIMVFSAISGSSVATAVAIGRVMIPKLIEDGYKPRFALGLVAASGGLGILIPPSVPLIVYAAVVEISIGDLFVAALGPGLLLGLALCVFVVALGDRVRMHASPGVEFFQNEGGRLSAILGGLPMVLFPVVILGGIYGGVFTPTEAAGVSVILAGLLSFTLYRNARMSELIRTITSAGTMSASILIIMGATSVLSYVISLERVPSLVTDQIIEWDVSPLVFLLAINVLLLLLGCFLEIISVILIVVPVILPTILKLGIDPIHFGIILIINMELAVITPPVGMNLFVVSAISGKPIAEVFKGALPFVGVLAAGLIVIMLFPQISTFMLRLL